MQRAAHHLFSLFSSSVSTSTAVIPTIDGDQLDRLMSSPNALLEFLAMAGKKAADSNAGMCRYYVQGQPYILIVDPARAYAYKNSCYSNMQQGVPYWETYVGEALIGSSDSVTVKRFREQYIHAQKDVDSLNTMTASIVTAHMERFAKSGEAFLISDSAEYFRTFALELALRLFAGFSQDDFDRMQTPQVVAVINELLWGPKDSANGLHLLGLKPGPAQRNDVEALEKLAEFRQVMVEKLQRLVFEPYAETMKAKDSLLYRLWKSNQKTERDGQLTLENFYPEAFFFLAGGLVITVADSLPSIAKLICQHPDVLEKLQAELDAMTVDGKLNSESGFPYLSMCIKEAFRLEPPVPVIPARKVVNEFELNGVVFKKDDCVVLSQAVTHKLAKYWDRPDEFMPERFLPENLKNIPQGAYFPHGLGPRSCIGRQHGDRVLKCFLANLFYRFDVQFEKTNESHMDGPTVVNETRIALTPRQPGLRADARLNNYSSMI